MRSTRPHRSALAVAALIGLVATACGDDSSVRTGGADSTTAAPATTEPPTTPPTTATPTTATEPPSTPPTSPPSTAPTTPPPSTEPPTTDAPLDCVAIADLPPLAVADLGGYDTVGVHEGLGGPDDAYIAMFTPGAAVAVQIGEGDESRVDYRIGPAGGIGPQGSIEHALLHDLVVTPSGPAVLYGEIYQGDGEPLAYLNLLDIGTGAVTRITESQAVEYFVYQAAAADGIVVTSAVSDLSENISTWALDGSGAIERYSPVLAENYGLPPFYGPAVPSPDGARLAWLEGPDIVGAASEAEGDWRLFVADAVTGEVALQVFLAPEDETFTWLEWDGEWALLSRGPGLPVTVVNTEEPEDSPKDLCGEEGDDLLYGVVTFVR